MVTGGNIIIDFNAFHHSNHLRLLICYTEHLDEKKTVEFVFVSICVRSYRLNTVLLAKYGKPGEIMNVTDDGIDASRRLFFCFYNHENFSDKIHLMHCFDHLYTSTKGGFQPKKMHFVSMLSIVSQKVRQTYRNHDDKATITKSFEAKQNIETATSIFEDVPVLFTQLRCFSGINIR